MKAREKSWAGFALISSILVDFFCYSSCIMFITQGEDNYYPIEVRLRNDKEMSAYTSLRELTGEKENSFEEETCSRGLTGLSKYRLIEDEHQTRTKEMCRNLGESSC